ncbi:MAG: 50S ribosomal protein L21 [bacterium]|nr:50S ribosomal protein L21 [bacterium]
MNFAIIETGGKQYLVKPGLKLKIEKLESDDKNTFVFDKVLLKNDGKNLEIGTPYVNNATVEAKLTREGRASKKIVFKYSSKTRYHKKKGHRQHFTEVEITKI